MKEEILKYLEKFDDFDFLILDKDIRIVFGSRKLAVDLKSLYNASINDILIEKVPPLNKDDFIEKFNKALAGNTEIIEAEDTFSGIHIQFSAVLTQIVLDDENYVMLLLKRYGDSDFHGKIDIDSILNIFYKINDFINIDDNLEIFSDYESIIKHFCSYFTDFLNTKDLYFISELANDFIILCHDKKNLKLNKLSEEIIASFKFNEQSGLLLLNHNSIKEFSKLFLVDNYISNIKNNLAFLHFHGPKLKSILIAFNYNIQEENELYKLLITIFNIYTDILERKINRLILKKRNEEFEIIKKRYENLFENMLDAFAFHKIILDENNNPVDYEFIEVNPSFCKMLNVNKEDVIGKTVLQLWPRTEKYWIENYGKVALTGEPIQFENFSSTFNKYFKVQAFSPENGYFAVIFHDITELILKQKELEIAKEKALEKEQLKTDFINNLSHELRTPLNGIIGFLDLINDSDITLEEVKKYFHYINSSSHKLINVVDNILNISQIQSNLSEVVINECNLNFILKEIFYQYKEIITPNIELKMNLPLSDEFSTLNCDCYKLKQIIKQLVDNSVKFTMEGYVEFGYTYDDKNIKVYCYDTGIGIDKNDFNKIFEPYTQLEKGLARQYGGNGLGLCIVSEYLKALNFTYKIESEIGKGTKFEFYIPKYLFIHNAKINGTSSLQEHQKFKILIAEDETINFEHIKLLIGKELNCDILHAANGKLAIDIYLTNKDISLIFMDIKMPVMDGFTAVKELRKLGCNVPIIGLTAFSTSRTEFLANEYGFDDIVFKPINRKFLLDKVKSYLKL